MPCELPLPGATQTLHANASEWYLGHEQDAYAGANLFAATSLCIIYNPTPDTVGVSIIDRSADPWPLGDPAISRALCPPSTL